MAALLCHVTCTCRCRRKIDKHNKQLVSWYLRARSLRRYDSERPVGPTEEVGTGRARVEALEHVACRRAHAAPFSLRYCTQHNCLLQRETRVFSCLALPRGRAALALPSRRSIASTWHTMHAPWGTRGSVMADTERAEALHQDDSTGSPAAGGTEDETLRAVGGATAGDTDEVVVAVAGTSRPPPPCGGRPG